MSRGFVDAFGRYRLSLSSSLRCGGLPSRTLMDGPIAHCPLFSFVCAVSDLDTVSTYLLASPDMQALDPALHLVLGAAHAAEAFNAIADQHAKTPWLIWVHEDVYLPSGWIALFEQCLIDAQSRWPALAVLGVYGTTQDHQHAGEVLDRGQVLGSGLGLPRLAQGLDEMLVAVRLSSGLRMDPALGWDFYASDLALQAQAAGFQAAMVHAPCEHWSTTPRKGISEALAARFYEAGCVYLRKWQGLIEASGKLSTPSLQMSTEADLREAIKLARQWPEALEQVAAPTLRTPIKPFEKPLLAGLEACWLTSAFSLEPSDEECASALARFYRVCGVYRFWHIGKFASIELRSALTRGLSRRWLLVLPLKACLLSGSFDQATQAFFNRPNAQKPTTLYRALSAHDLVKKGNGPAIDYATGAGFDRYSELIKMLPLPAPRTLADDELVIDRSGYWLIDREPSADGAREEVSAIERDALIGIFCAQQSLDQACHKSMLIQDLYWPFSHCFHDYRHGERREMLRFIPKTCERLLDWGGGEGGFAMLASREHPHLKAWVADIDEHALQQASSKGLSVIDTRKPLPSALLGSFDLLAMLDSLEHMDHPGQVLREARSLLKPGGYLLLSIPHIGFAPVLQDLAQGHFEYEAVGPLCITHRRFYSATGLRRLLQEEHFEILQWEDYPHASHDASAIEAFHVLARAIG